MEKGVSTLTTIISLTVEQISRAGVYINTKLTCPELLMVLEGLEIDLVLNGYCRFDR